MTKFEEKIVEKILDYYVEEERHCFLRDLFGHNKDYKTGIESALKKLETDKEANELDKDIHAYEQGYNELMDKTGKLFLEDSQFYISGILSQAGLLFSILAVIISIISLAIASNNSNCFFTIFSAVCLILIIFFTICTYIELNKKAKEGKQTIEKIIAVNIRQFKKSLERENH